MIFRSKTWLAHCVAALEFFGELHFDEADRIARQSQALQSGPFPAFWQHPELAAFEWLDYHLVSTSLHSGLDEVDDSDWFHTGACETVPPDEPPITIRNVFDEAQLMAKPFPGEEPMVYWLDGVQVGKAEYERGSQLPSAEAFQ